MEKFKDFLLALGIMSLIFITSPFWAVKELFAKIKTKYQRQEEADTNIPSDKERIIGAGIKAYEEALGIVRECGLGFIEDHDMGEFFLFNDGKKVAQVRMTFPAIAGFDAPVFVTGLIPKDHEERDKLKFVAPNTWACWDPTALTRWAGNKHYVQLYELEGGALS